MHLQILPLFFENINQPLKSNPLNSKIRKQEHPQTSNSKNNIFLGANEKVE